MRYEGLINLAFAGLLRLPLIGASRCTAVAEAADRPSCIATM